ALLPPDAAEPVGMSAEELVKQPGGGFDKQFIPDDPAVKDKILHHTKLVQPLQSERLQFPAPTTPGDYPFICSFPLHYKTMTGTLHVVPWGTLDAPRSPRAR